MVPKKEISMVPDMGKWKRSQVGSSLWASSSRVVSHIERDITIDYEGKVWL